jgi:hypothetical protein
VCAVTATLAGCWTTARQPCRSDVPRVAAHGGIWSCCARCWHRSCGPSSARWWGQSGTAGGAARYWPPTTRRSSDACSSATGTSAGPTGVSVPLGGYGTAPPGKDRVPRHYGVDCLHHAGDLSLS